MEYSSILARVLGAWCVIIGAGVLFNQKFYQKAIDDFSKNHAIVYIWGLFALAFGLIIVTLHNFWVFDWRVIITLLGWAVFLKGVFLLTLPTQYLQVVEKFRQNGSYLGIHSTIILTIGLILIFSGYSS